MPVITFIESSGARHSFEIRPGDTVMQVATCNDVPGIIAECGGAAACATCRVRVDEAWESRVPPPGQLEMSLIEAFEEDGLSGERLSCQIVCTADLDGLVVHIPISQD